MIGSSETTANAVGSAVESSGGETPFGPEKNASNKEDWETPDDLFRFVDKEFDFLLDAASTGENAKCEAHLTEEEDGLTTDWHEVCSGLGYPRGAVWLNPPYGRGIGKWIKKAYEESQKGTIVVVLTFARTDTRWWHDWAMKAPEIRLIPGRITFKGAAGGAPAPSCLLIFDEGLRIPRFCVQRLPRK